MSVIHVDLQYKLIEGFVWTVNSSYFYKKKYMYIVKKSNSRIKLLMKNSRLHPDPSFSISDTFPKGKRFEFFFAVSCTYLTSHVHERHTCTSISQYFCCRFFWHPTIKKKSPTHQLCNEFPYPLPSPYSKHPFCQITSQCLHYYNYVNIP